MILVRSIGMSGYVPLEGVFGLSHALSDCLFCRRKSGCMCDVRYRCPGKHKSGYEYLPAVEYTHTSNYEVLQRVVSFVFFRRFSDSELSILVRDVGLLSGYYCAGVLYPRQLFRLFISHMGLRYYRDLAYVPYLPVNRYGWFLCSTAWAEYISIDRDLSHVSWPRLYIQVLDFKKPFPEFKREGDRILDVKRMLRS